MSTRNHRRCRGKRRNIFIIFLVTTLLLLLGIGSFSFFQYEEGKSLSQQEMNLFTQNKTTTKKQSFEKKNTISKEPENHEPVNILLIGTDKSNGGLARTDTIMIAQYNPLNGESKIASIMRDSYVEIPGRSNNKINAAFAFGGVELLQETIQHNFDIDIHYYAIVDFGGFVQLVDTIAPNGLPIKIENRMYDPSNAIDFLPGQHFLDGDETLNYVRFRKDHENDFGRVRRQQEVISALKNELFTVSGLVKLPKLIGMVEPQIETNIRKTKMLSLSHDVMLNPITDIKTLRIPTDDGFEDAYFPHAGSVLKLDLPKNALEINNFFANENDEETNPT